jgi:hypothetical protein
MEGVGVFLERGREEKGRRNHQRIDLGLEAGQEGPKGRENRPSATRIPAALMAKIEKTERFISSGSNLTFGALV